MECGKTRWKCHNANVWPCCAEFANQETEMFDLHQRYEEAIDVFLVWLLTLDKSSYVQKILRDHGQEKLSTRLVLPELTQVYDIKDHRLKDTLLNLVAEFFEKVIVVSDMEDDEAQYQNRRCCPIDDDHLPVNWKEVRSRMLPIVGNNIQ